MVEEEARAADEASEEQDLGRHSSAPDEGAGKPDIEDRGQHSSAPEEGAREPDTEDLGHHASAPEEGALGAGGAPTPAPPTSAAAPHWDRLLIVLQLVAGVALVVFGALLAALTKEATHDIGTAVIGIGAVLLPAGAAASATARIGRGR
jgi:hypothetical protein